MKIIWKKSVMPTGGNDWARQVQEMLQAHDDELEKVRQIAEGAAKAAASTIAKL